ncbi:MAG: hypothetical protein LBH97_02930 [Treponema sp.]|jgi:hypothetical protein|nr:hypothetical protein [Treponema sp.]
MRIIAFLLLLQLFAQALIAEDQPEDKTGVDSSGEIILQISSLPEIKLGFTEHYRFPFLQGESPLTADNNIDLALSAEIAPISLNGIAKAVFTPIAFFQMAAGVSLGTGWNIELFGKELYGIGINRSDASGGAEHNGSAFDGMFWKLHTGAVFQMDLAALFPGDWNHVVFRSAHEINYKAYTRAKAGESWYFENDSGENCNGFNYYGNLVIGYQMPIFLNMAALLTEADLYLYDTPDRGKWGDDEIRWRFSLALNFTLAKQLGLAVITQFITKRNYQESNWQDLYYRNRTLNSSTPQHLEFYRVAAILTYKL